MIQDTDSNAQHTQQVRTTAQHNSKTQQQNTTQHTFEALDLLSIGSVELLWTWDLNLASCTVENSTVAVPTVTT
jgi:NADH:ubiquinone oxidoreductase subunit B-like Fe-S oxidoreductase